MNVFILTGTGVSAESGLGTLRDKDGLWTRFNPMKLATPEACAYDPDEVHAPSTMRRQNLLSAGCRRHISRLKGRQPVSVEMPLSGFALALQGIRQAWRAEPEVAR
jgi:hypothetical protein